MRCLPDAALERLLADLGTGAERAHLVACPLCAARYRAVLGQVDAVVHALVTGDPPVSRVDAPIWRWPIVAALAGVAAGVLLWMVVGARAPDPAARDEAQQGQAAVVLTEISYALFSVEGEPGSVISEGPVSQVQAEACDDWWRDESVCSGTLGVLIGVIDPTVPTMRMPSEESGDEP